MNIRPIRTEEDLTWALAEVEPYFLNEPAKGSDDAIRFEILADLIRAYEALHWSIDDAAAVAKAETRLLHRRAGAVLKRKSGLMSASSGRLVVRPSLYGKRQRRSLKVG